MIVNPNVMGVHTSKKTKTPRKTQKNNNLLKTKRILSIKISAKGGPALHLACQGGGSLPVPRSVTPLLKTLHT